MLSGVTTNDEKDPSRRIKKLEERRLHLWEAIITMLDQASLMSDEITELRHA